MSAYIDYHLKTSHEEEEEEDLRVSTLDLRNRELLERVGDAIDLMGYCGKSMLVTFRITTAGKKEDLVRLLEEVELPFKERDIRTE